ncbi:uncharacterized protein LOC143841095 [Paroedura picta]|uniref:uncharacterized protein LOC143841095 n=1 Tax=Paroedura picta TaxID=143630 RepID=UPI0040573440
MDEEEPLQVSILAQAGNAAPHSLLHWQGCSLPGGLTRLPGTPVRSSDGPLKMAAADDSQPLPKMAAAAADSQPPPASQPLPKMATAAACQPAAAAASEPAAARNRQPPKMAAAAASRAATAVTAPLPSVNTDDLRRKLD